MSALVGAVVFAGGMAFADHQFPDVPDQGFHDEIGAIIDAGCATGFQNGTFQPKGNTTRGQFAYWMNNCGGRVGFDTGNVGMTTNNTYVQMAQITIEAGAAGGVGGFVFLQANITGTVANANLSACPCRVIGQVYPSDSAPSGSAMVFDVAPDGNGIGSAQANGSMARVFPIGPGETNTYVLDVKYMDADLAVMAAFGDLTAIYVPFGPTGGSTGIPAPEAAPESS